jgi:hypothetical protein
LRLQCSTILRCVLPSCSSVQTPVYVEDKFL